MAAFQDGHPWPAPDRASQGPVGRTVPAMIMKPEGDAELPDEGLPDELEDEFQRPHGTGL